MIKNQPKKKEGKVRPRRRRRNNGSKPRALPGSDSKVFAVPVARSKLVRTQKPIMETKRNGDCRIRHREYIADIVAAAGTPSAFVANGYVINPGQSRSFPWLSRVASNYESYRFDKLIFAYETEAPSSLGGTLVLTIDYDAADAAPTSKQQAMAYRSSVRSAPWTPCLHASIGEDLHKAKSNFIRLGAQPPGTDIKTYDIGNLFVISQGVTTASATLGELYVEYDVMLMTPVFENVSGVVPVGGTIDSTGTETKANPFGDGTNQIVAPSYGISVDNKSRVSFANPGTYIITFDSGGVAMTNDVLTPGPGVAVLVRFSLADATGAELLTCWRVIVTDPGYFDYTITGTSSNGTTAYVGTAPAGSIA